MYDDAHGSHGEVWYRVSNLCQRQAGADAAVGQIVGRMNEVRPVRSVMFDLVDEYIDTMQRTLLQCDLVAE
jgi:hypothetical protein